MNFIYSHNHVQNIRSSLQPKSSPQHYAAVVGKPEQGDGKQITGPSGDHLQFYIDAGDAGRFQVDVNTQSRDGSPIEVYVAVETAPTDNHDGSGLPAFGVFPDAQLSYKAIGLIEADFTPQPYYRIDAMLNAALLGANAVSVYGMTFDDGGRYGKGIHDIHMDTTGQNQDGALLVHASDRDGTIANRTWYFFKFQNEQL